MGALAIKRRYTLLTKGHYLATADQLSGHRWAKIATGQTNNGIGPGIGLNNLFTGDNDTGAHTGQAKFGKTQY